jgi:hypothetical protein
MPQVLEAINGVIPLQEDDESLTAVIPFEIDGDGSGPSFGDPDYQPRTTYRTTPGGTFLNSLVDIFIVLPPPLILRVKKLVIGCQAFLVNLDSGLWTPAVVADSGPTNKFGEGSEAAAKVLGIPWSPTSGGISNRRILCRVYPGVPATCPILDPQTGKPVGSRTYDLEPYPGT